MPNKDPTRDFTKSLYFCVQEPCQGAHRISVQGAFVGNDRVFLEVPKEGVRISAQGPWQRTHKISVQGTCQGFARSLFKGS